jgi:hypothetical protein
MVVLPFPTPESWRADARLSVVSFHARGLWIELLALMHLPHVWEPHISSTTGHVALGALAELIGSTKYRLYEAIQELEEIGVIDRSVYDHPVIPPQRRILRGRAYYGSYRKRLRLTPLTNLPQQLQEGTCQI